VCSCGKGEQDGEMMMSQEERVESKKGEFAFIVGGKKKKK
jgi:hypothetical protein